MPVSAIRTIVVSPPPSAYGVLMASPTLRWPVAQPADNLDYSLDLTAILGDVSDSVAEVVLDIMPSGSGELAALDLAVNGNIITAQLSGGVAGRSYTVRETITGVSGRAWQYLVQILIDPELAVSPLPTPPNAGFGTPLSWTSGVTIFGPAIAAVQTGLIGTGTNQATALPLPAQTNIIASAPSGTGFILSGAIVSGTIVVQNDDPTNNAPIYPPDGAQINSLGVNVPFIVGSQGARISFSTQNAATQWYAG